MEKEAVKGSVIFRPKFIKKYTELLLKEGTDVEKQTFKELKGEARNFLVKSFALNRAKAIEARIQKYRERTREGEKDVFMIWDEEKGDWVVIS